MPDQAAEPIAPRAVFSANGLYRYELWMVWDESRPLVAFIGLNPSMAGQVREGTAVNDATSRKLTKFARAWGFGGYGLGNVHAFVATKPAGLFKVPDPVGPDNAAALARIVAAAAKVVACWGVDGDRVGQHAAAARRGPLSGTPLYGFRDPDVDGPAAALLTQNGQPRHPLYLPDRCELFPLPDLDAPPPNIPCDAMPKRPKPAALPDPMARSTADPVRPDAQPPADPTPTAEPSTLFTAPVPAVGMVDIRCDVCGRPHFEGECKGPPVVEQPTPAKLPGMMGPPLPESAYSPDLAGVARDVESLAGAFLRGAADAYTASSLAQHAQRLARLAVTTPAVEPAAPPPIRLPDLAHFPPAARRPCKLCPCPIVMAPSLTTGKTIPLDTRTPVYLLCVDGQGRHHAASATDMLAKFQLVAFDAAGLPWSVRVEGIHPTHYATCPAANQFGGGRRQAPPPRR